MKIVKQIQFFHKKLQQDIQFLSHWSAFYYNQKRDREPTLKERDKVYLLTQNIKTKQPSKKLDNTKLEPFKVKATKGSLNYKLELPPQMKIHLVFHIMLLECADSKTLVQIKPPGIDPEAQEIKYNVKQILDQQEVDGQTKYLIK